MTKRDYMKAAIMLGMVFATVMLITYVFHGQKKTEKRRTEAITKGYHNVWVLEDTEKFSVLSDGEIIEFASSYMKEYGGKIIDVNVKCNVPIKIRVKDEKIHGKILAIGDSEVEIEGYGKLGLSQYFRVYDHTGKIQEALPASLLVGYDIADFVIEKDVVQAAIIRSTVEVSKIRVLLRNDNFEGQYHGKIDLTCDSGMVVEYGKKKKEIPAKKHFILLPDSGYFKNGRIKITPKKNATIKVNSMTRGYGTPCYQGTMEVTTTENGLVLINEVDLEKYIESVVSSEVPSSYSEEGLKAQAVCARTYAYHQIESNSCSALGAHVDDGTYYQVYGNMEVTEQGKQAVASTRGEIMTYKGKAITAFFFSTSCGTTTLSDIWGNKSEPYIKAAFLGKDKKMAQKDFTKEEIFSEFIHSTPDCYESELPLFRWKTTMSQDEISYYINLGLGSLSDVNCKYVGTVNEIYVTKRGKGGIAKQMKIIGTHGTAIVNMSENIRGLFDISGKELILNDGNVLTSFSMLPSSFFTVDKNIVDEKVSFTIVGGGFGHGIGMSQNGADVMGKAGMDYKEILQQYYQKIEFKNVYKA